MYRLVIVDDEEKIVEGIANLFPWNQIGFEIVGKFQAAKDVVEYVRKEKVDVVMSDVEMPDMNGMELCGKLQEISDCKFVFFSSHQNYEYFRSAIKQKAFDYLLKPIRYDELLSCFEKVKEVLQEEHRANSPVIKTYYEQIVSEVKEYLKESYKDASLEVAAQRVNLSSSYLSKIFKEKAGIGFADYLLKVRMEKACAMLEDIRYKSYDIAYYVGYDNPKNFSRAFKAFYKMSPTDYRNLNYKKDVQDYL